MLDGRGGGRDVDLLARYWDHLTQGEAPAPAKLDPTMIATIDTFQALAADEPERRPDPAFVYRLLEDLLETTAPLGAASLAASHTPPLSFDDRTFSPMPHPVPRRGAFRRGWSLGHLATAAVLLLTLVSSLVVMGPLYTRPEERRTLPASAHLPAANPVAFVTAVTGSEEFPLLDPAYVNVDPAGNLWVADGRYSRYLLFAPDGAFLEEWGIAGSEDGQFNLRAGGNGFGDIAWDSAGNLYVVDTGNARIQKFDPQRRFLLAWGTRGSADAQFQKPLGVAIGADDRIYVTDAGRDDVQVFDPDGQFLFRFGGFGLDPGQLLDVRGGIASTADGTVLITDYDGHRIHRFSPDGEFIDSWGTFGGGEGELANPDSIAVDAMGRVYITENWNHRVQVLTGDGEFVAAWGSKGTADGQFVHPTGIVIDQHGTIFVADSGNARIQLFRLLPALWPESVILPQRTSSLEGERRSVHP